MREALRDYLRSYGSSHGVTERRTTTGAPSYYRSIREGATSSFGAERQSFIAENPGEIIYIELRGSLFWHKPIERIYVDGSGKESKEIIGYEIKLSLMPSNYVQEVRSSNV